MSFNIPLPEAQINFAAALNKIRGLYLQDALSETVKALSVPDIDKELATYVSGHSLTTLASQSLRGEMVFPVPIILAENPRLLGYYRLLYGYSQKEFYSAVTGMSRFKAMEERGMVNSNLTDKLPDLARALCGAGELLLAGIGIFQISVTLLDNLTLLTLGPQLRGGANVRKGVAGILTVFNVIHELVANSIISSNQTSIVIKNGAGRKVVIEFSADPDIVIFEEMATGSLRHIIAIEVKAGSDFSNIHNRIGEAEKSHQKAKRKGYPECWTVVNVNNIDMGMAKRESPTTNHFYRISDIVAADNEAYDDFKNRLISLIGIAS